MGIYTGLRGTITLNDEYADKIRDVMVTDSLFFWRHVLPPGHPFLDKDRCDSIPYGAVCYMPGDWEDGHAWLNGNEWQICCSLKNYSDEIATFVETVLPLIAKSWDLESLYEEADYPDVHIGSAD